jgi:hypothetical protein
MRIFRRTRMIVSWVEIAIVPMTAPRRPRLREN